MQGLFRVDGDVYDDFSDLHVHVHSITHLWPTNTDLELPKESSRLSSRLHWPAWPEWTLFRTAPSLQNDDGLDGPASYSGRKRHKSESVRTKALQVWRPGNRMIYSGGPKLSSRLPPSSILLESHDLKSARTESFRRSFVLQRSVPISVSTRSCSRAHTFWYVPMVVAIETITPKHVRRTRKTSFWSTLDTLIFVLFSSLCCLGPCAAIATLQQMLANNCYETHERSKRVLRPWPADYKWTVLRKAAAYRNTTRRCNLCIAEKLEIMKADKDRSLNRRSELVSECRHENQFTSAISLLRFHDSCVPVSFSFWFHRFLHWVFASCLQFNRL